VVLFFPQFFDSKNNENLNNSSEALMPQMPSDDNDE